MSNSKHTAFPKASSNSPSPMGPNTTTPKTSEDLARDDINRVMNKLKEYKGNTIDNREFDPDFLQVYLDNQFMATIAMKVNRQADNEMPTAYVGVHRVEKDLAFVLGYNEKFFRSLNRMQRMGVIQHEF